MTRPRRACPSTFPVSWGGCCLTTHTNMPLHIFNIHRSSKHACWTVCTRRACCQQCCRQRPGSHEPGKLPGLPRGLLGLPLGGRACRWLEEPATLRVLWGGLLTDHTHQYAAGEPARWPDPWSARTQHGFHGEDKRRRAQQRCSQRARGHEQLHTLQVELPGLLEGLLFGAWGCCSCCRSEVC